MFTLRCRWCLVSRQAIDQQVVADPVESIGLAFAPAREAYIGSVPMTVLARQVPPWASGAHDPENRLEEPTIPLAVRPGSVTLPGKRYSMRSY